MIKEMTIWGRKFSIKILFDAYSDEEVSAEQIEALESFCMVADDLLTDSSEVKEYCIRNNKQEIGDAIDNIFRYVIPVSIYVKRENKRHVVSLLCDYKYDEEHGLAITFENEKLLKIGSQDDLG